MTLPDASQGDGTTGVAATAPLITVLMASYGRLPLLKEAVASALAQDYPHFEVLIVDDGSAAPVREWLRNAEAGNDRLRVVFQDHLEVAAARARGVSEARGELICILDSDDSLVPHALQRLAAAFAEKPEAVLVHTHIRELRPDGVCAVQAYPVYATARAMLLATLMRPRVPFKHSGTTFRRDMAMALGSYDSRLPCKVDIDFYLKFLSAGHRPHLVAEPLVNFRMHKDSVSRHRWRGLDTWFELIDRYGPPNPVTRAGIKLARGMSEVLKQLYIEVKG